MRFVKKSHITLFPKLPFRLNFRKPFRNLPVPSSALTAYSDFVFGEAGRLETQQS